MSYGCMDEIWRSRENRFVYARDSPRDGINLATSEEIRQLNTKNS